MSTIPPQFQYSSKFKNFSVFEDEIEKRVKQKLYKDKDEVKDTLIQYPEEKFTKLLMTY